MAAGRAIGRSAFLPLLLLAAQSQALDIGVQPRVSAGIQDYELTYPDVITASPTSNSVRIRDGFTIRDHVTYAGTGLSFTAGRLIADLSGQWSRTGEDQGFNFQGNVLNEAYGGNGDGGHDHYLDSRFGRQEFNAALGWALSPNFSAYLGYKNATLNLSQARTPFPVPAPQFGDVLQMGTAIIDFSYHGFFLGTTYALPVGSWGALSVQASIAQLSASFRQHFEGLLYVYSPGGDLYLNPALENSSVHGDSDGLNVGVAWTGNFGVASNPVPGLTYTLGFDQSQYRFHGSAPDGDFEEKNTRFRFELRYRFRL